MLKKGKRKHFRLQEKNIRDGEAHEMEIGNPLHQLHRPHRCT